MAELDTRGGWLMEQNAAPYNGQGWGTMSQQDVMITCLPFGDCIEGIGGWEVACRCGGW